MEEVGRCCYCDGDCHICSQSCGACVRQIPDTTLSLAASGIPIELQRDAAVIDAWAQPEESRGMCLYLALTTLRMRFTRTVDETMESVVMPMFENTK